MASLYQDFIIQIDQTGATKQVLSLKATWYSGLTSGDKISQVTEISIDDGTWFPMVANAATQYTYSLQVTPSGVGQPYNVKIKEGGNRIFDLGGIFIASIANQCPNLSGDGGNYFIQPSTYLANNGSDRPLLIQAGQSGDFSLNEHSIDNGVTYKTADVNGITNWTQVEVDAVPSPLQVSIRTTGDDLSTCLTSHSVNLDWPPTGMVLTEVHTNPTTNDGNDGLITISVENGSGDFSFLWSDASTLNPITGLIAGTYSVDVTDNITSEVVSLNNITLTDPDAEIVTFPNTLVTSSPINPIRFKDNLVGEDLPLENYNFCEQPTENMAKPFTPEIFNVQDQTRLQFISDFAGNVIKKTNVDTGAIESLSLELSVDNISGGQKNNISISDNGLFQGLSTVRLNRESLPSYPNPLVGDIVSISLSSSYNGSYAIVDISQDLLYIVINTPFIIEETATLTFLSKVQFNVYELPVSFADWGAGNYKLTFEANDGTNTVEKLTSEYIAVKPFTPNTLLMKYSNNDNAYGVVWTTDIIMTKRHEGFFVKIVPTRDSTNYRNSNDSPGILNAYVRNKEEYNVFELPWYSIQRLALIYSCDNFVLNGKSMFVEELPETEQPSSRYLLGKHTVIAEQIGWLDNQNTHDIGDTSEDSIVIGGDTVDVLGV